PAWSPGPDGVGFAGVESVAGQVPPTGEPVADLLARIGRQAALIGEYRDREAAKDAVIAALRERAVAQDAKIGALDLLGAGRSGSGARTSRPRARSRRGRSAAGRAGTGAGVLRSRAPRTRPWWWSRMRAGAAGRTWPGRYSPPPRGCRSWTSPRSGLWSPSTCWSRGAAGAGR